MAKRLDYIYNKDLKEKFIEETREISSMNTVEQTLSVMQKIERFERKKNKSVFDMSKAEILEMLISWELLTKSAIDSSFSILQKYVLSSKLTDTNGYISITRISVEDKENCIDKDSQEKKIVSLEMYEDYLDREANAQDKAVMILLWNGFYGDELYSDIINLKKSQYNYENATIDLNGKVYHFTEKENEILRKSQTDLICVYYDEFGEERSASDYMDGDYFIRNALTKRTLKNENNQISHFTMSKRLNLFFRQIEAMPVTGLDFYISGWLHRLTEKYDIRNMSIQEIYDVLKNEFGATISSNKLILAKKVITQRMNKHEGIE